MAEARAEVARTGEQAQGVGDAPGMAKGRALGVAANTTELARQRVEMHAAMQELRKQLRQELQATFAVQMAELQTAVLAMRRERDAERQARDAAEGEGMRSGAMERLRSELECARDMQAAGLISAADCDYLKQRLLQRMYQSTTPPLSQLMSPPSPWAPSPPPLAQQPYQWEGRLRQLVSEMELSRRLPPSPPPLASPLPPPPPHSWQYPLPQQSPEPLSNAKTAALRMQLAAKDTEMEAKDVEIARLRAALAGGDEI